MQIRHPNIKILKRFCNKHPNIIKFYGTFQDEHALYYVLHVMEYAQGGELWSHLVDQNDPLRRQIGCSLQEARFYIAQVINALAFMGAQGVVHRDLKPENMIKQSSQYMIIESGHLKLIDFMTCKDLVDPELNGPEYVGTPEYMAPEAINGEKGDDVNCSADLWSLGCFIFQLIAGYPPFKGGSDVRFHYFFAYLQLVFPQGFDKDAQNLISNLLTLDPKERNSNENVTTNQYFAVIKQHPFFNGICWDSLHDETPPPIDESELQIRTFETNIDEECYGYGTFAIDNFHNQNLDKNVSTISMKQRFALMHRLDVKEILLPNMPLFYKTEGHSRSVCARRREYLGLGRLGNDSFSKKFSFMYLSFDTRGYDGTDLSKSLFRSAIMHINVKSPTFVVISGRLIGAASGTKKYDKLVSEFHKFIGDMNEDINICFVSGNNTGGEIEFSSNKSSNDIESITNDSSQQKYSRWSNSNLEIYRHNFGDDFYGIWVGGIRCLFLNSSLWESKYETDGPSKLSQTLHQKDQMQWLKHELYVASLCAQHVLVFAQHSFFNFGAKHTEDILLPLETMNVLLFFKFDFFFVRNF
eukprot:GSMAST32.ASY1.ANO1.2256.1 assembled CDS